MKSSSAYTNYIRVKAQGTLTKVEFPGGVARNNYPLNAAIACPVSIFDIVNYKEVNCTPLKTGKLPCIK
jgi:hypothetical protein